MSKETVGRQLAKGLALTAADVREIELELALLPPDDAYEVGPWVWEGVALIVTNPEYRGDAKVPA